MKLRIPILILFVIMVVSCSRHTLDVKTSVCEKPGTIQHDPIANPTQGFPISFDVYLPPCYEDLKDKHFPVIYLITMPPESRLSATDNTPMSLADRLIHTGKMPPALIVVSKDIATQGYHAALAIDLIPYMDERYNTLPERRYRGVGGISHGAAIAARMAFQFPETFGSLGMLSDGIDKNEKEMFKTWIVSAKDYPRVLIDIGDQDGIMPFTQNLLEVLDSEHVPYELNIDPGGHDWAFWSAHMEAYLLWFAEAWE